MSMEKIKKISYDDIKEIIEAELAKEESVNSAHRIIVGVLAKWEGKKINKRIREQVQYALRESLSHTAEVFYEAPSTFAGRIIVTGILGHETYDKRISFYLTATHDAAAFEHSNASSGRAASERIQRRREMLKNTYAMSMLADSINKLNAARAEVDSQIEEFESDKYAIERFSGLRDDQNRLY
jgi:CII-binding regulator of phage lambda lysogenization HflD